MGNDQVFAEEIEPFKSSIQVEMKDVSFEVNGNRVTSPKPMIIYKGQRFLPFRELIEASKKQVNWNQQTRSIYVDDMLPYEKSNHKKLGKIETKRSLTFDANINGNGAIVVEDEMNQVMFEKNSHLKFYPASTVKIMTALLALEKGDLDTIVTVSKNINLLPYDSRRAYIRPGDRLTLKQLLYGMLLYSGNDCALAIAEHIAGSEAAFIELMNQKAKEIGAINTHFVNPHGYHHPNQYTTPYDLALIAKEASKDKRFINIIQTSYYKAEYKNKSGETVIRHWDTTNQFLKNDQFDIKGILGGKTGFTDASKHNLVTFAEYNGHQYISVILKGTYWDRYRDTSKLLKKAYNTRQNYDLANDKKIEIDTDINEIVYNGWEIQNRGGVFIYRNSSYISEKFARKMLQIQSFTEQNRFFQLSIERNIETKLKENFTASTIFGPLPLATDPISLFVHAFNKTEFLLNYFPMYHKLSPNKHPFWQMDVEKITVKTVKPYLPYKNVRL